MIHKDCLTEWLEVGIRTKKIKPVILDNGKRRIKCELCRGDILFKQDEKLRCRSCEKIKKFINEDR